MLVFKLIHINKGGAAKCKLQYLKTERVLEAFCRYPEQAVE